MTAITAADTRQLAPVGGIKELVILTDSACATGMTFDASSYFSTIYSTYLCDGTGAVKIATFSGTTVTIGTVSTGVHCLRVLGI